MENQVNRTYSQNAGRYLQSLDSVRFAESDSEALYVQARVELLVSLLFGQTIPIGEHQFLDSSGFIPNAVEFIKSLEIVDNPRDRMLVESIFPFRVGIRSVYMPIDNFIATKLGDTGYQLSKWDKLNKMPEIRLKIKKLHEENNFTFDDLYTLLPDQEIEINELKLLRDRFLHGEEGGAFHTYYQSPTVMEAQQVPLLSNGLEELCNLDEALLYAEIDEQRKLLDQGIEPNAYIEPELYSACVELIHLLKELKVAGLLLNNRSSIRKDAHISRKIVPDPSKFGAILEIFDRLYNSAAAEAVHAYSEEISSARDFDDTYIRAGISLAELAISKIPHTDCLGKTYPNSKEEFHWTIDTDFSVLHNLKTEISLKKIPWEVVWYAYLDISWKKSLNELNSRLSDFDHLLNHPTDNVDALISAHKYLDDAISTHVENISRLLEGSLIKIHKDSKTGETFVGISTDIVTVASSFAASYVVTNFGLTFPTSGVIGAIGTFLPKLSSNILKPYIPKIAAWNTNGQIKRVFKKIFKNN
jgi:hypothetical protein